MSTLYFRRLYVALFLVGCVCGQPGPTIAQEGAQGTVIVDMGDVGRQAETQVHFYPLNSPTPIATAKVGTRVDLPPGNYRLELDVLGGKISREKVLVKAGRTSTIIINEVAILRVDVLDRKGKDLGLSVEVYDAVSGEKLGDFLSGETLLAYPGVVDIKVATPPQGQWWRKVELRQGSVARLEAREQVQTELRVRPVLEGKDISSATEVVIYRAGTQKEVARSKPSTEHRFTLGTGTYDIYVQNTTGKGKPFVTDHAEIATEEPVEKTVPLDVDAAPAVPPLPRPSPVPPQETQTL
ncbi:MAG: hypothetical protein AB7G75_00685 [Candidatus Binatia bacterium]